MKTLLRVALCVFLLNVWLPSAIANSNDCQSKGKATVVFDVTNGLGEGVGETKSALLTVESFLNIVTNQESRRKFRFAKGMWSADKIPYGRYTLRVRVTASHRPNGPLMCVIHSSMSKCRHDLERSALQQPSIGLPIALRQSLRSRESSFMSFRFRMRTERTFQRNSKRARPATSHT